MSVSTRPSTLDAATQTGRPGGEVSEDEEVDEVEARERFMMRLET